MQATPKLRLVLVTPRFVTSPIEEDRLPDNQSLTVSRRLFDMAVALAARQGFKLTGRKIHARHLTAGQVADLARHIRAALAAKAEPVVRVGRRCLPDLVDAFFELPARLRSLNRLLEFLELGGELSATEF